jgi:hypothetical protein
MELSSTTVSAPDASGVPVNEPQKSFDLSFAGLVRPILVTALSRLGSLKFLPKTIAKSADRLSAVVELREHYYTSQSQAHLGRFKRAYKIILPVFVRNALIGTAVYSSYESSQNWFHGAQRNPEESIQSYLSTSLLCGLFSGATGGVIFVMLDKLGRYLNNIHLTTADTFQLRVVNHAITHGLMFYCYEGTHIFLEQYGFRSAFARSLRSNFFASSEDPKLSPKNKSSFSANHVPSTNNDTTNIIASACCTAIAGGFAGLVFEASWQALEMAERLIQVGNKPPKGLPNHGIQQRYKQHLQPWKWSTKKAGRSIMRSVIAGGSIAFPSSLAFLAYEFGRDDSID